MPEERLWCTACGTVTRDKRCDCNRYGPLDPNHREPNFVNYADTLQKINEELLNENNNLRIEVADLKAELSASYPGFVVMRKTSENQ